GQGRGSAVGLGLGGDIGGGQTARHHVIGQDLGQFSLLGRLHQTLARGGGNLVEGGVVRGEDREGAGALQALGQAGGLKRADQGGQVGSLGRVGDQVVGRVHRGAADHGFGRGGNGRRRGTLDHGRLFLAVVLTAGGQGQDGDAGHGEYCNADIHGVSPSIAAHGTTWPRWKGYGPDAQKDASGFKFSGVAR